MLEALALAWLGASAGAAPPTFVLTDTERTLQGDWATPAAIVVSHHAEWPQTLNALVAAATPAAKVLVVHEYDASLSDAVDWWRALPAAQQQRTFVLNLQVSTPWLRDFGPFVSAHAGEPLWIDASVEATRPDDDALPSRLASRYGADVETLERWVDGGAVVSNGAGLCAAVGAYFDDHAPARSDGDGQRELFAALGCRGVAYLPGVDGDSTDHADVTVQFTAIDRVVVATSEREQDRARLDQSAHSLRRAASRLGLKLHVERVPSRYQKNGRYLSYVNGLRLHDRFLMPTYGKPDDPLDAEAQHAWQAALGEDVLIVPVPVAKPAALGGAVHCLTLGVGRAADPIAP